MITFKQYLEESRSAPLYHGTDIKTAVTIIQRDMIEGRTPQVGKMVSGKKWPKNPYGEATGVSLSRNFRTSKDFGDVIFELDQQKLTNNHKIVPLNYFDTLEGNTKATGARSSKLSPLGGATEAEEFVRGSIKNLDRYLTAIHINEKYRMPALESHPKVRFFK